MYITTGDYWLSMIPVVGSLTNLGLLILSFILGFFTHTILPFEYKRLRRQSDQSQEEVRQWNQETRELLSEVRTLAEKLEHNRNPNLKQKAEDVDDIRTRLKKHQSRAPDGASDDVEEKLGEMYEGIGTISYAYSDFYTDFPDYQRRLGEIPFETEYDSKVDDEGNLVLNRLVRDITDNTLHDCVYPLADEIEEELDQSEG